MNRMTKIYNPQEDREVAKRAIELAMNFHKYGTPYPTEEQIRQAQNCQTARYDDESRQLGLPPEKP